MRVRSASVRKNRHRPGSRSHIRQFGTRSHRRRCARVPPHRVAQRIARGLSSKSDRSSLARIALRAGHEIARDVRAAMSWIRLDVRPLYARSTSKDGNRVGDFVDRYSTASRSTSCDFFLRVLGAPTRGNRTNADNPNGMTSRDRPSRPPRTRTLCGRPATVAVSSLEIRRWPQVAAPAWVASGTSP